MKLEMKNITKTYPGITIFKNLDFILEDGKITCLLGPSGCGKTTLLNLLAGSLKPDEGIIKPDITGKLTFLFQESRLLPWITVLENICYLMEDNIPEKDKREWGMELIRKVGLSGFENSYPQELSGGMERRVSLARAFGKDAALLLMDEPFSSIDDALKAKMIKLMKNLFRNQKKNRTVLYVTHDTRIASELADTIVYMKRIKGQTIITDKASC